MIIIIMFQALVQRLLNKILGEYLQNFSAQNLKIGIWSGEVVLRNVTLKKSVIKKLNLPLKIKYSKLGCLKMNIPWKSLTSNKIQVLLEGLELVVAELPSTMWECKNTRIVQKRKKEIESFCEAVLSDFAKKSQKGKQGSQQGYFSRLIIKIIDNLQVTIKDIHIRYQDDLSKTQQSFSFGVTLEQFKLYTVNSKGEPQYIDRNKPEYANEPLRKKLELYNIGIYWNEKSQIYNETNYEQKMVNTIAKRGQSNFHHNYLILMSSQAELLQREPGKQFSQPQINLQIQLENLKLEISNNQLQQIIVLAERLQKYTKKVKQENKQKLSQEQISKNKQFFATIFPQYYNGWGRNTSKEDIQRLQQILQKMQVQNFTKDINQYLQTKQKQRIIKQKQQKNRGWWFGKPKELTSDQLNQIQNYLNDNFGQQVSIVKRPIDYYYIKIGFKLKQLQIVIANSLAFLKQGIQSRFDQLDITFALRDGGYSLQFTMEDIAINIFKQMGVDPKQYKQILYKLYQKTSKLKNSYLSMSVIGNPLDKKYLNTDIKLVTSELMLVFDPKIIQIAVNFADLNVSKQNKEAAIQKFGEIKEKTQAAVSETIDKPSKAQIGVDVKISSVTVAIPFSPHKPYGYCWGLNLGSIHFTTDQATLLRVQAVQNLPLDVFNMQLAQFSFKYYPNINILKESSITKKSQIANNALIDHLDFRLKVETYNKPTQTQAKIKIYATLPYLSIDLNQFTYKNLLKIGDAFEMQSKQDKSRMTARIDEKKQIQKKASKVGFVHIKDSLTKIWKKYVALMTDNYIYLYINKNDKDYFAYYYIKGAKLQKLKQPLDKEKPYHFRIKNKINQVVFGFDKEEQIDDWINKIHASNKQKEMLDQMLGITMCYALSEIANMKPPKKHDQLNLFVNVEIQTINIKVYTTESTEYKIVSLNFSNLSSKIYMHQSKKRIQVYLFGLQLQDSIQRYNNKELSYFLLTKRKLESENLINLDIQQLNKDHPKYDHTQSSINVSFGTLVCNYKCQTVKSLMAFFIPQNQEKIPQLQATENDSTNSVNINASFSQPHIDFQTYSLKLNVKIQQISVTLVNEKVKTIIGKIGITNLNLYMGISQKRMILLGSLKDLYYIDTTNYPNTIYKQQEFYPNQRYILTANIGEDKNMLDFNIEILKEASKFKKTMFIDMKLANLTTYYVQQPILRLITYLNTQMLPSFETGPRSQKKVQINDSKPDPSAMQLKIVLSNISVFVQTEYKGHRKQQQEYIQLNIQKITVNNNSVYKSYIKSQEKRPIILVQSYLVQLYAMSISVKYFNINNKHYEYKLTNNLDMTVSTDLIVNPQYYKKQLPDVFDNGMRVQCIMTPFFMRINHDDYNFIMKCLNWGITHNDGLDDQLYDIPGNQSKIENPNQQIQKDPFYLVVKMDCISLFVTDQSAPIAFLLLDKMDLNMCIDQKGMSLDLALKNLYGTSIQHNKQQKTLNQIGVFNSLGYSKKHKLQDFQDLKAYFRLFDRRAQVSQNKKTNILNCIIKITQSSLDIKVQMSQLWIDIDIRLLMVLSTLANTDEKYIQGPIPIKRAHLKAQAHTQQKVKTPAKKMEFQLKMQKIVGSVSDKRRQKYFMIEGGISFAMSNYGDKTIQQIYEISFRRQIMQGIPHSIMKARLTQFTIYFVKIKDEKILAKRQFLRPNNITYDLNKVYKRQGQIYLLSSEINTNVEEVILTASLKDILNINKILQDNIKILDQFKPEAKQQIQPIQRQDLHQQIKNLQEDLANKIQPKTKLIAKMAPIQVQLVNDCESNFMPVLRLLIHGTQPAMNQTILSTQFFIVPIISLYFFNPRSSRFQPIIQPFKAFINYSQMNIKSPKTSITVKTGTLHENTSSLKINVSTQMFSTLMATKDIIQAEQQNIDKNIESKEIEVSPYIFYNITNQKIYLIREENQFQLSPLFKGPIRIKEEKIKFRLKGQTHLFSLEHYGVLKIPGGKYFIKFDTQKLNRIIKFLPLVIVKNRLHQAIYIKRFGNVPQLPKKIEINQPIPLDNVDAFAVSLNGNSYTQKIITNALKLTGFLLAEKKNFVVLLKYKQRIDKFAFVNLLSPFIIHNCLPKNVNIQFIQKAKTKSTSTIKPQQSYQVFTSENILQLQLKIYINGYSWSNKFKYHLQNDSNQCKLLMQDEDGHKTTLNYIFKKNKNTNQFILIIYCKKIIVNQLNDKLLVYGNSQLDQKEKRGISKYHLLGGQTKDNLGQDQKIIMVGEQVGNMIRVCGRDSIIDFATPIAIGGLGSSMSRIVVDRQYQGKRKSLFTVLGVQISAIKMMKQCDIYSKKIVLKSKSIIINHSKRDIIITQQMSTEFQFVCEAGCKKNFVFGMPDISNVHYKYKFSSKGMKQSKLTSIPLQGARYFKLESIDQIDKQGKNKQYFFKIYIQQVDSYMFYQISQITQVDLPYQIVVKSKSLIVRAPKLNLIATKDQVCTFFDQLQQDQHLVQIVINHDDSKQDVSVIVCPDNLKFRKKELITVQRGGLTGCIAIVVQVSIKDKKRTIIVDQQTRIQQQNQIQQSTLLVQLAEIVISVNQNSQAIEVPYESMVITLRRLLFIKYETDKKQQFQVKLGFMQIDQAYPYIISSPVILTPYKYQQFTREKDPKNIFNFTIVFSKEFVQNTFISEISVDFDDIVATFSSDFINLATAIFTQFGEVINYKQSTYQIDKKVQKWQQVKIPPQGKYVFIKSIRISPFVIDLSAQLNIKKLKLQNQLLKTLLSTFGIVMSSIDAPIQMTGIQINDCIDTVDSITKQLVAHYKSTCVNQLYKVFGSLNIIGNPLGLFRNISTGVKDLKQKPAQGFVNGPAEFGFGIVQGTGSLLAHSIGGAFNSISKVTGTFSSGLATLAFDQDFQQHRQKQRMKKPQNVIQGLQKGGKAIFYGFKQGFTGVFTQPYENAKKQGALGFVKGAAKGLAGLVVKPVTGIIDFASKTTQGIKNNALMFEDKAHQQRMRYPRVFYTECYILKEYSKIDSQLFSIMKKMQNQQKFQNPIFVATYATMHPNQFLVILSDSIVYFDIKSRHVKWTIDFNILQMQNNKEKKMLFFKRKAQNANFFNVCCTSIKADFDVEIQSDQQREEIISQIRILIEQRNYH